MPWDSGLLQVVVAPLFRAPSIGRGHEADQKEEQARKEQEQRSRKNGIEGGDQEDA